MGALHISRADTVQIASPRGRCFREFRRRGRGAFSCGELPRLVSVHLTLIRNATLVLRAAGLRLLVDPQLDPAGARPAVPNTPNPRPNPLVALPAPPEAPVAGLDAVLG